MRRADVALLPSWLLPQGLIDLAPQLGALRLVLPPETLAWRLTLLQQGSAWLTPRLKDIQQRVLVLAGDQDLLIPSREEAVRLGKALPRARSRILPNRSHALLQEAGVDLVQLLEVRAPAGGSGRGSVGGGSGAALCASLRGLDAAAGVRTMPRVQQLLIGRLGGVSSSICTRAGKVSCIQCMGRCFGCKRCKHPTSPVALRWPLTFCTVWPAACRAAITRLPHPLG